MSRLAILIPFGGNAKRLEDTLVSVLENRPNDCEIVVVLAQPYENPYHLDDEVCFVSAPSRAGIAACLNLGLAMVRAPFVHVLACGVEVPEGWADAALAHFHEPTVAAVAPLVLDLDHRERVLCAGVAYQRNGSVRLLEQGRRSVLVREASPVLAPHPAAAFYRRSALEAAGRFSDEVSDGLAMVDLGLTFQHLGLRTVLAPRCTVAASIAVEPPAGAYRRSLDAERFFWRWSASNGWTGALAPHALHAAADCLGGLANLSVFARLAGRLVGFCRGGAPHQHRLRLERLAQQSGQRGAPAPKGPTLRGNTSLAAVSAGPPTSSNGRTARAQVRRAR